jgi:hypothetical protein
VDVLEVIPSAVPFQRVEQGSEAQCDILPVVEYSIGDDSTVHGEEEDTGTVSCRNGVELGTLTSR